MAAGFALRSASVEEGSVMVPVRVLTVCDGSQMMDFGRRSAIEWLSLQNNERTHAEMLGWLLSECSRLGEQRVVVLRALLGDDAFADMDDATTWTFARPRTEVPLGAAPAKAKAQRADVDPVDAPSEETKARRARLDLVVELSRGAVRHAVVIEYKMKSSQSEDQLKKYDAGLPGVLGGVQPERLRKVLLTFDGDAPASGDGRWISRSYSDLRSALERVDLTVDPATSQYLTDYKLMLDRMVHCRDAVCSDVDAAAALLSPSTTTRALPAHMEMREYADSMKIRHLLAKAWLQAVESRARARFDVLEFAATRVQAGGNVQTGGAILNVYLAELHAPGGAVFRHGLQVQDTAFKAFTEPHPDRKLEEGEVEWANALHAGLRRGVEAAPKEWKLGTKVPVKAGKNGFRSKVLRRIATAQKEIDPSSLDGNYDPDIWADAVVGAIRRIRATTTAADFPDFTWTDLTSAR
jgi:hypothetical protein